MYERDSDSDSGYNSTDTITCCEFVYIYTTPLLKTMNIYALGSNECSYGDGHWCSPQEIEEEMNFGRDPLMHRFCVEAVYDTLSSETLIDKIRVKLNSYRLEMDDIAKNVWYRTYYDPDGHDYSDHYRCEIDTIKEAFRTEDCVLRTEENGGLRRLIN